MSFLRAGLHLALGNFTAAECEAGAVQGHDAAAANALSLRVRVAAREAELAQTRLAGGAYSDADMHATAALAFAPLSTHLHIVRATAALAQGDFLSAGADASAVLRCSPDGYRAAAPAEAYILLAQSLVHVFPGPRGAALAQRALRRCMHEWGIDHGGCGPHAKRMARMTRAWEEAQAAAAAKDTDVASDTLQLVARLCGANETASSAQWPCALVAHAAACALHGTVAVHRGTDKHDALGVEAPERGQLFCDAALLPSSTGLTPGTAAVLHTSRGWVRLLDGDAGGASADVAAANVLFAQMRLEGDAECLSLDVDGSALDVPCHVAMEWLTSLEAAVQAALAPPDHYSLLNVSRQDAASMPARQWRELLRRSYRRAALTWHPDKLSQGKIELPPFATGPEHMFLLLAEAFRILSDPALRDAYDAGLPGGGGGGADIVVTGQPTSASSNDGGGAGVWVFHYDKRDVDADGTVLGTWVRDGDGARRKGRRPTPNPHSSSTAAADASSGQSLCDGPLHGNAQAARCLPPGAVEERLRKTASEASSSQHRAASSLPRDGYSAPLAPKPTLTGRSGCTGTAQLVVNHFGLASVHLEFTLIPSSDDDHDEADGGPNGVKPGYGPRMSPGALEALREAAHTRHQGCVLQWTPPGLASTSGGPIVTAGDVLVYQLKWLAAEVDDEEGEQDDAESIPPAFVSLDLRWTGGEMLSRTGAADDHGVAAGAGADVRKLMASQDISPGGWLERRIVLPLSGALDVVLFACAARGGVTIRAAVRHVRVIAPNGDMRLLLLPSDAADMVDQG